MAELVGVRLKSLREFHGWSQRELAKRAGVPNSAISVIEQGSVSPSVSSLAKVLKGFPLSLADFFSINVDRLNAKVTHEEPEVVGELRFTSFYGQRMQDLSLRSFVGGPDEATINLMSRGQTVVLLLEGEAMFRSPTGDHHLKQGSSLSLRAVTPFRLEPQVADTRWAVATIGG